MWSHMSLSMRESKTWKYFGMFSVFYLDGGLMKMELAEAFILKAGYRPEWMGGVT